MKRTTLNIVLGVVVAGLAAGVYFSQEKEEKGPPLTLLTADAVTKIVIEHPGVPAVRLQKEGGQWRLTEPVASATDPLEVNALLGLATAETKLTLEGQDLKLAELGLEPPQYAITLNDHKLEFGGVEPLNYRRYVRSGGKIVLVDDPPSAALDKDYSDLVSKAPIPEGAKIEKIVLPGLIIARSADDKSWTLSPDQPEAGSDARQKLVDSWRNARALWMAAEPAEPTKGSKGEEVVVTLKDSGDIRFVIAERDPQLVLARPDLKVRYTLSKALEAELLKLPEEKKEEDKEATESPAPAGEATEPKP